MKQLATIIRRIHDDMRYADAIHTDRWQSIDISKRPEAQMRELTNVTFTAQLINEDLKYYQDTLNPNLPWADRHFVLERISGQPINPGTTWKEWPYANSAEKFQAGGVFSHSYAERYWPKWANEDEPPEVTNDPPRYGIRYPYGDLYDLVKLLANDPYTRQAYLPVWFPEDTGVVHGERVPCTLGYHFMMRKNCLNIFYPIRSCDFVRHFRDDIYLTVRLGIWVLQQCRMLKPDTWNPVSMGHLSMWIGSLHCFINDWNQLYGKNNTR